MVIALFTELPNSNEVKRVLCEALNTDASDESAFAQSLSLHGLRFRLQILGCGSQFDAAILNKIIPVPVVSVPNYTV